MPLADFPQGWYGLAALRDSHKQRGWKGQPEAILIIGIITNIIMYRKTRQRQSIIDVLRNTTSHPSVDWVYDEVQKVIPNISQGTVYRNLRIKRTHEMANIPIFAQ
jgi:hypothetical protein